MPRAAPHSPHGIFDRPSIRNGPGARTRLSYTDRGVPAEAPAPQTRPVPVKHLHADQSMGITDLHNMARKLGIQFMGVDKYNLVRKINHYAN